METQRQFFKKEPQIQVYRDMSNPETILKKYMIDYNFYRSTEDLFEIREKLMAIKHCKCWPDFIIKPSKINRLNKYSFIVEYPFVEGVTLDTFLKSNDIDLLTCARFIKSLEEKVMSATDFVFPDIANKKENARGMKKCLTIDSKYNKQLDIRSMYAIFYRIMNSDDFFYPVLAERSKISEYENILDSMNIPIGGTLYNQTFDTLDDNKPNKLISDSLFELVDDGYELETYNENCYGYQHRLIKK